MTYSECMQQLKEQDLHEEFCCIFQVKFSESFLNRMKNTDRIHSVASLIRTALTYLNRNSPEWERWVIILKWFMMPEFERLKINLKDKL